MDLELKPSCGACGSTADLYGSSCKHLTLCVTCGKSMAEKLSKCGECGTPITRLIREYNIRASFSDDKNYYIATGLPSFTKNGDKWSLQKESLKGRQVTDALRERFKNRPWLLEDGSGQLQYRGHLEGTQATTYYFLVRTRKDLIACPAASWYIFNKVPQYKQLTLEEAEEKIKNRRRAAIGFQKRMVDVARSGAAAFGNKFEKPDNQEGAAGGGRKRKRTKGDDDEASVSDREEEDEDEEPERISRLGLNESGGDDSDEEGFRDGDSDDEDHDIQQGDWEYEEMFSDDDEAIGELEEMAMETEPPEIKQDDEDDDEVDDEWGTEGLSISGKELKKLLRRTLNDYNAEHVKDDTKDGILKKEAPKGTPVDNSSPLKAKTCTAGLKRPPKKSSKGKKCRTEEARTPNCATLKKVKIEYCSTSPSSKSDGNRRIQTPV